nr:RNA-directed DNA polymerase, eukaryota [Tanacetum cinerariifolium]
MWGNFAFDYACSMSRGRSRGILSVWDPYSFTKDSIWCDDSFVIVKGKWNNSVGDENSKFFHRLINQKRRNQMINGLMVDGTWIMDPKLIKDTFLQFYEVKFQAQDDQVVFPNLPYSLTLDNRDRDNLERQVNLDEIKEAIWDCGSSKASGPDGYTFAFVKKFWGTIHIDLHEFVDYFFTFSTMPHGANSSFFTLIPKVNNPTCIMDFPPISLIGIHYKIITKILANSLAKVVDKIISKEQSAFIAGCQILDGPLILTEIIEWYKIRQKKLLIFKVDFEKAFDSISWKFMDHIPVKLAFDDVIITSEWNARELKNIIRVLHIFYHASGLKINIHKSNIYGIGVNDEDVSSMAHNMVIDRFQSRLSSWKANILSFGGRLTLIKSMLGSLDKGGLNIDSLKAFNLALLQKWRWRMLSSPNSLWVKVIKAFHGQECGFDSYGRKFKGTWANIVADPEFDLGNTYGWVRPLFVIGIIDFIVWTSTKIASLKTKSKMETGIGIGLEPGSCNLTYFRDMLNEIGDVNIEVAEDTCYWSLGSNGIYTVKEARQVIDLKTLPSLDL